MASIITEKKLRFEIPAGKQKERIDIYLTHAVENATRSKVQKLIEAGLVLINGKIVKSNYSVKGMDVIDVTIPVSPRPDVNEPEDIPLDILYEDDYLLVVNKPAGMVAHPAFGNYTGTLVNALLHHTKQLSTANEPSRPGIVHRIDKNTSGLLLIAKDDFTHSQLAKQFAKHSTEREYWAVVWGKLKQTKGEINFNITRSKSDRKKFTHSRSEGKTAITFYEVIKEYDFTSLIKLKLQTGRTHQIRVHLAAIGHPVFGDETYGGRTIQTNASIPKLKSRVENLLQIMQRQALHAKTIGFFHPHKKEMMKFDSSLPQDFTKLLDLL